MSRELAVTSGVEALGNIAARHAHDLLGADVAILLNRSGELVPLASTDSSGELARQAIARSRGVLSVPMSGSRGPVGVLAARMTRTESFDAQRRTLETMVAQTALALERAQLASEAELAHVAAEAERTRNTLLAGLSHDLRTPLSAIHVSAGTLLDPQSCLDPAQRTALLETVRDESEKLAKLVTGMLDLVRFESGTVRVVKEWCPIEEILSSAIGRLEKALKGRPVSTSIGNENDMLMVAGDPVLLEQVFVNLLDNAAKYTPLGTPIEIRARVEGATLRTDVADHGRGISPGDEKRVFQKFFRSEKSSRACPGAGLGLALCDAIVRAHGGRIEVGRGPQVGAVFSVFLPLDAPEMTTNRLAEDGL